MAKYILVFVLLSCLYGEINTANSSPKPDVVPQETPNPKTNTAADKSIDKVPNVVEENPSRVSSTSSVGKSDSEGLDQIKVSKTAPAVDAEKEVADTSGTDIAENTEKREQTVENKSSLFNKNITILPQTVDGTKNNQTDVSKKHTDTPESNKGPSVTTAAAKSSTTLKASTAEERKLESIPDEPTDPKASPPEDPPKGTDSEDSQSVPLTKKSEEEVSRDAASTTHGVKQTSAEKGENLPAGKDSGDFDFGLPAGDSDNYYKAAQPELVPSKQINDESSHFFLYFTMLLLTSALTYTAYHNRKKIMGLVLEGRRNTGRGGRGRRRGGSYLPLHTTLEETMSSNNA